GSSAGFASVGGLSTGAAVVSAGAGSRAGSSTVSFTEGATSAGINSGSGNNERDETSDLDTASTGAGSKGVSVAGVASATASGTAASASVGATATAATSAGFGLRSRRYPSERKIEAKSSPDAPVRDVIVPLTTKLRPSKKPSGFGPGAPSRHDSAGLMRSARRSRMSTRTARSPQMR